jgi:hypothetical protein
MYGNMSGGRKSKRKHKKTTRKTKKLLKNKKSILI